MLLEGIVEADEAYVGGKESNKHASSREKRLVNGKIPKFGGEKTMVFGLLQRDGKVINQVIPHTRPEYILPIIQKNVKKGSHITTDDLALYRNVIYSGFIHSSVSHSKGEYVNGESHTGTLDGYWGLLKRGIIGIYHSASKKHLHRYCDEFSFRYNTRKLKEVERYELALKQSFGRRLKWDNLVAKR